jgi:hypothetical protein
MPDERAAMLDGLNMFRALEAWGAALYAQWAASEDDPVLRAGHLIIAEREANHARLLAERLRALGAEPGPACVDGVLARQLAELSGIRGFVAQLDALKAVNERDADALSGCQATLARGFDAAKAIDPATPVLGAPLQRGEGERRLVSRDVLRTHGQAAGAGATAGALARAGDPPRG